MKINTEKKINYPAKSTLIGITLILIIFTYGILGSIYIMHLNLENAIYFTMITIATVGYGDITPITSLQKLFVIILAFDGIGIIAYIFTAIIDNFSERLEKSRSGSEMRKKLENMKNHYIVCGYGRVGSVVIKELLKRDQKIIIVDNNKETIEDLKQHDSILDNDNVLVLYGDATNQETMDKFNIEDAYGLILTTGSDVNNVFIVLSLRDRAPDAWIISRASKRENIQRLYNAGADKVISPETSGGLDLFLAAIEPYLIRITDINKKEFIEKEVSIILKHGCNIESVEYHLPGIKKPFKREVSIKTEKDFKEQIEERMNSQESFEVLSSGTHSQLISGPNKQAINKVIEELKENNLLIGVNMSDEDLFKLNKENLKEIFEKQ
ncbi:MAG: NAD-binding protein [Methanobrevibacter sp.]